MYYLMADVVDVFKANAAVDLLLHCSAHCIPGGDDDDGDDDNDDCNDDTDDYDYCSAHCIPGKGHQKVNQLHYDDCDTDGDDDLGDDD